jgi:hypothetical protein
MNENHVTEKASGATNIQTLPLSSDIQEDWVTGRTWYEYRFIYSLSKEMFFNLGRDRHQAGE